MSSPAENYPPGYLEQDRRRDLWSVCTVFIVLTTFAIVLRLIARRTNGLKWGLADLFAVLGYVLCIALISCVLVNIQYGGIGFHQARVEMMDPNMFVIRNKFLLIISLIYLPAVVMPKLSIILLYLDIFIGRPVRIACYAVIGLIIANWLAGTISAFFICIPLDFLWNPIGNGHCFNTNAWFRWGTFANILSDAIILVLPIPSVLKLHCSLQMKLGILFTFGMGTMGLIASVIRFIGFFGTNADADITWTAVPLFQWSVIECGVYLIACCLPTYRPLARLIWQKSGLQTTFSRKSQTGTTREHGRMSSNIQVSYEFRQTDDFIPLKDQKPLDEESIGLVR